MNNVKKSIPAVACFVLCVILIVSIYVFMQPNTVAVDTTTAQPQTTQPPTSGDADASTVPVDEESQATTTSSDLPSSQTNPSQTQKEETTGQSDNIDTWNKQQIITKLSEAVNKTKAYTGDLSVHHIESFDANITEITGGSLVASLVNSLIGKVVKPTDETLAFNNGSAVNTEGETIPLLLPENGNFSLSADGVTSAKIENSGNGYKITLQLISETCGIDDVPKHNASGIGYLNIANLDVSFLTITSANIVYSGSSITALINADGMISEITYKIPLHVEGAASVSFASGHAVLDGQQEEIWKITW